MALFCFFPEVFVREIEVEEACVVVRSAQLLAILAAVIEANIWAVFFSKFFHEKLPVTEIKRSVSR